MSRLCFAFAISLLVSTGFANAGGLHHRTRPVTVPMVPVQPAAFGTPVAFGAAPVAFGTPVAFGAAPMAFGTPVTFGAAPSFGAAGYGSAPVVYGADGRFLRLVGNGALMVLGLPPVLQAPQPAGDTGTNTGTNKQDAGAVVPPTRKTETGTEKPQERTPAANDEIKDYLKALVIGQKLIIENQHKVNKEILGPAPTLQAPTTSQSYLDALRKLNLNP